MKTVTLSKEEYDRMEAINKVAIKQDKIQVKRYYDIDVVWLCGDKGIEALIAEIDALKQANDILNQEIRRLRNDKWKSKYIDKDNWFDKLFYRISK